jgi:hypothetical protein
MKRLLLVIAVLLQGTLHCFAAGDYNTLWQNGNTAYQQKKYDSALYFYEQLSALKPRNAELYYNIGNTYYRLNRIAFAVLNYERALKIDPEYKEAKENLALAQSRISNNIHATGNIFFIQWWESLTRQDMATQWSVWAFVTFIIFMVILLFKAIKKTAIARTPVQVLGILALVFCCCLGLALVATNNSTQTTGAVVMQNDAPLMNADLKGKPLLLVPEGTTVKIKNEKPDWVEVTLPDGRDGWLRQNLVTKI